MASDVRTTAPAATGVLVNNIVSDLRDLVAQETALLQHELREDARKTKEAGLALAFGLGTLFLGGYLLAHMLVHGLAWVWPAVPMWG